MNAVISTTAATARYRATRLVSWEGLPEGSVGIIASVARARAIPLRLQRSRAAAEVMTLLSRSWRAPTRSKAQRQVLVLRARTLDIAASLCAAARPISKCSVAPRQVFRRGRRLSAVWGRHAVLDCTRPSLPMHSLAVARKQTTSQEILLWMTPSEAPKALQASECSELLDPMRASCWISAQH